MSLNDLPDELFDSMTPAVGGMPASQQLRDAVLSQTTRTIRNRRRMRRARIAATLVACYLGGIATVSLWPAVGAGDRFKPGSAIGLPQTGELADVVRKLVRPEDD